MRLQAALHKTIVFITHDFDEAIRLADRIAIMRDGHIVQSGTAEELVLAPADDYVAKPFEPRELLARMRAVLRRPRGAAAPLLDNGVVSLDPSTFEARTSETACRLTAREFACLQALMHRPGVILSRQDLEGRIYGWNEEVESNAVEFLIHAVRRKLGNAVIRNRAKRRLREAARLTLGEAPPPGWDLVLIARDGTGSRPWDKLLADLRGALRQAGVTPE